MNKGYKTFLVVFLSFCLLPVLFASKALASSYPCENNPPNNTCGGFAGNGKCGADAGCDTGQVCTSNTYAGVTTCKCQLAGQGICFVKECPKGDTLDKCGEAGGCYTGRRCLASGCGENPARPCVVTGVCNDSTLGKCGSSGGCPTGSRCIKNYNNFTCSQKDPACPGGSDAKKKIVDLMYNGPRITNILQLITPVAKALYFGGIFIGFCFIVYSGYALMTSEGNPQRTQDAQGQLTSAILGIMFILLSAAILRVIINSLIGGNISI